MKQCKETAKKIAEVAFLCVMCQSKGKGYFFRWTPHVELVDVHTYTDEEFEDLERILYVWAYADDFIEQIDETIDFLRKEYKS